MYRNSGKLRWYQGPARISQILVFTVLVKEMGNEVGAFERSRDFSVFNGKINLSDWCIGVMEGFNLLTKSNRTKELHLTKLGEKLYDLIMSDEDLYGYLKQLFAQKSVSTLNEKRTLIELKKSIDVYDFVKKVVDESEQFQNVYVFLLTNGTMTMDEFKQGFFSEIKFLYNGEAPIMDSSTATTADNRLPFIHQFGRYFELLNLRNGKIRLDESIKTTTITKHSVKKSEKIDQEIIDQIDNVRISRAVAYLGPEDLKEKNNRDPKKFNKVIGNKVRYKTNPRIAKTALKMADYKCEHGLITNEDHITFTSKFGYSYAEAHHLIPMAAQGDFPYINLDRTENIVSLCPICHSAIHYGNKEERKAVLTRLYHYKIIGLQKISRDLAVGIDGLLDKYYK